MFAFHSVQPVMFHHSSRGLGHDPQQVLVFVYTNALLAKFVFEKIVIAFSWKMNLHFWLAIHRKQCLWLSTLSDAACWENPNPPWAQNICGYAFKERFLTRPKILKTPDSKKSQVFLFNEKACCHLQKILFQITGRYVVHGSMLTWENSLSDFGITVILNL